MKLNMMTGMASIAAIRNIYQAICTDTLLSNHYFNYMHYVCDNTLLNSGLQKTRRRPHTLAAKVPIL